LAYTQGNDIHFAPGQYSPETSKGQELLGHELTHVVQQRQGRVQPTKEQGKGLAINDNPALENEADRMGKKASEGKATGMINNSPSLSNIIQKSPEPDEEAEKQTDYTTFIVPNAWKIEMIANAFNITTDELIQENSSKLHTWQTENGEIQGFYVEEKIIVPSNTFIVPDGWNLSVIASAFEISVEALKEANQNKLQTWKTESGKVVGFDRGEQITIPKGSVYASQLDNEFYKTNVYDIHTELFYGEIMCNVTTLAMQLMELFPNEVLLRRAAIKVLEDAGYEGDTDSFNEAQIEDILLEIFQQIGEDAFQNPQTEEDGSITPALVPGIEYSSNPAHEWLSALGYVGALFTDYVDSYSGPYSALDIENGDNLVTKDDYDTTLQNHLDQGDAIMLSTLLYGGHIVYLKSIKDDGIVIHDPYGMRMPGGYVKNGSAVSLHKDKITGQTDTFNKRTKHHTSLRATINSCIEEDAPSTEYTVPENSSIHDISVATGALEEDIKSLDTNKDKLQTIEGVEEFNDGEIIDIAACFPTNMGELNFYDWQEVTDYKIGINSMTLNK
jgi:hypothetical protein